MPVDGDIVQQAEVVVEDGKPVLKLALRQTARRHLRRMSAGLAYFRAPRFSADGREARLPIGNIKAIPPNLPAPRCASPIDQAGKGLEQSVTLP